MNAKPGTHSQEHLDLVVLFALQALPPHEIASVEAQISSCEDCQQEIETLRPIVRSFVGWSTDVLRPAESLWGRLANRIASETATRPFVPPLEVPVKPEWEEAAPGIHVKIFATNVRSYDPGRFSCDLFLRRGAAAEKSSTDRFSRKHLGQ